MTGNPPSGGNGGCKWDNILSGGVSLPGTLYFNWVITPIVEIDQSFAWWVPDGSPDPSTIPPPPNYGQWGSLRPYLHFNNLSELVASGWAASLALYGTLYQLDCGGSNNPPSPAPSPSPPQPSPPGYPPPSPRPRPSPNPNPCPPAPTPSQSFDLYFNCETYQTIALLQGANSEAPSNPWINVGSYNTTDISTVSQYIAQSTQNWINQNNCNVSQEQPDGPPPIDLANPCAGFQQLTPGSEDYCNALDDISQMFSTLGHELMTLFVWFDGLQGQQDDYTPPADTKQCPAIAQDIYAGFGSALAGDSGSFLKGIISGLIPSIPNLDVVKAVAAPVITIFQGFLNQSLISLGFDSDTACKVASDLDPFFLLRYLKEMVGTSFVKMLQCGSCNVPLLTGLVFVKSMLGFLKKLRGDFVMGFNLVGKAGLKVNWALPIEIKPLEKTTDYLIEWSCPVSLPSEGELLELALRQEIKPEHLSCLLKLHGVSPYFHDKMLHVKREKIGANEIIQFYKRHPELPDLTDDKLKQMGYIDDYEREMVKDLFVETPNIELHLEWLRRNVDDYVYQAAVGAWQGFDTRENVIALFASRLEDPTLPPDKRVAIEEAIAIIQTQPMNPALVGRNFWNEFGNALEQKHWNKFNSFRAYLGHWAYLPREIGAEFVQRLRKGRVPDDLAFDINLYRKTLIEQDIEPRFIDRYIATAYRTINQRFIMLLAKEGLYDEKEIGERLQDIGFTPADSATLAHGLELQRRKQIAAEVHGWDAANILHKYSQHLITWEQALPLLQYLGYTDFDINQAKQVADLQKQTNKKNEAVSVLKRCYLKGVFTSQQAIDDLIVGGLTQEQANEMVQLWEIERGCDQHSANLQELLTALKQGLLGVADVATRLLNMNYSDDAISIILASAVFEMEQRQFKEQEQWEKQQAALAKALQQQLLQQKRSKQRRDRIALNLTAAKQRAALLLMRAEAKANALTAKNLLKLDTIAGLAQAKDGLSKQLLSIAQDAKGKIQPIKDQLAIDLSQTKDKTVKAQLRNTANDKIAAILRDAQDRVGEAKKANDGAKVKAQEETIVGPIPPPQPTPLEVATGEATAIVSQATQLAAIESET